MDTLPEVTIREQTLNDPGIIFWLEFSLGLVYGWLSCQVDIKGQVVFYVCSSV